MPDSPASVPNLRKKLAEFEEKAKAIRQVLELLGEDAAESSAARADTIMQGALKLDATRRNGHGQLGRPPQPGGAAERIAASRAQTAERLAAMSRTVPSDYGLGTGSLLKYGYIARKGGGYVRTAKPYPLTREEQKAEKRAARRTPVAALKKTQKGFASIAAKEARHQKHKQLLDMFDRKKPLNSKGLGRGPIGNLVRQGFLAKKGDGLIRTGKPFPEHYVPHWARGKKPVQRGTRTIWVAPKSKRTAKAAQMKATHPPGSQTTANVKERRARSAAFLALFGHDVPTMPPVEQYPPGFRAGGLGPLVRRGYLQKVGDGYVRTAKVFSTDAP